MKAEVNELAKSRAAKGPKAGSLPFARSQKNSQSQVI